MDRKIKTTRDFASIEDIDFIISGWAKKTGFTEGVSCNKFNPEDMTYCFTLDENNTRIIVAINILDDKVHMETWALSSVGETELPRKNINTLLESLGQKPI